MTEAIQPILFGILLVMIPLWLVLNDKLHRALRDRHPGTFKKLGSPRLTLNNRSVRHRFRVLRFLLDGKFKSLKDPPLSKLCRFVRIYFWCYLILFLGLVGLFLVMMPVPSTRSR
jgi:hypothetical protein